MDGTIFRVLYRDVGLFAALPELEDLDLRILRVQNRRSLYPRLGNRAVQMRAESLDFHSLVRWFASIEFVLGISDTEGGVEVWG